MRIDLHTHSRVSDGTQTPTELIRAAAAAGLDVIALTDHDTCAGWDEAAEAADRVGIGLVRGLEISAEEAGASVHLLAYLPAADHPGLAAMLDRIRQGRDARVPQMVARLRELGSRITVAEVDRVAGPAAAVGRPHVADALVGLGEVQHRNEAFDRLLGRGRPAYVDRWAAPLEEAIRTVEAAGGVSVLAHPWGRGTRRHLPESRLAELAGVGLAGVEVAHQDHRPQVRRELAEVADRLGLIRTGSSDHHGTGKVDHELGCHTTEPEMLDALLERAGRARAAATGDTGERLG
ncbi:PHP domain-containing protein [Nocardioides limicola]|uniref:PHP domain-containing protein n=1 Tax=Nocardioides limicola TaxID=2803368 RepID=UPI00193C20EC|nr:PHP domain-containing protein [Nocardioides sp. DJM-14]